MQRAISKTAEVFSDKVRFQLVEDHSKRREGTTYKIEEEENKASGLDLKFLNLSWATVLLFYKVSIFILRFLNALIGSIVLFRETSISFACCPNQFPILC